MRKTLRNHEHGSTSSFEVTFDFRPRKGRKNRGPNPADIHGILETGNVPRVSRLMALAIRFDGLIRHGQIRGFADLARLGYVSRARITQIMNLLNLSPDIQENILFLPKTTKDRDPIREKNLRAIVAEPHWSRQRKMWANYGAE
jgi:hypothetical protein